MASAPDIVSPTGASASIVVPATFHPRADTLLRLGTAAHPDEAPLPPDPARPDQAPVWNDPTAPLSRFANGMLAWSAQGVHLQTPSAVLGMAGNGPAQPPPPGIGAVRGPLPQGMRLVSTDQVHVAAPKAQRRARRMTQRSSHEVCAVGDSHGTAAVSLASAQGGKASFSEYARLHARSMWVGAKTQSIIGNSIGGYAGNNVVCGLGGQLWGNIGLTQRIYGLDMTRIGPASIGTDAFGASTLHTACTLTAMESFDLFVSPLRGRVPGTDLTVKTLVVTALAAVVLELSLSTIASFEVFGSTSAADGPSGAAMAAIEVVEAMVLIVQAMTSLAGLRAGSVGRGMEFGGRAGIRLTPQGVAIQSAAANRIDLSELGINLAANGETYLGAARGWQNAKVIIDGFELSLSGNESIISGPIKLPGEGAFRLPDPPPQDVVAAADEVADVEDVSHDEDVSDDEEERSVHELPDNSDTGYAAADDGSESGSDADAESVDLRSQAAEFATGVWDEVGGDVQEMAGVDELAAETRTSIIDFLLGAFRTLLPEG